MINPSVPPPVNAGEITVQDTKRQDFEWELTRSNWRFFMQMQAETESPLPGTGRRDDDQTTPTR